MTPPRLASVPMSSPSSPPAPRASRERAPAPVVPLALAAVTDAELLAGVIERRPSAVAELFDRFAPTVRRVLARTLGNARDLDDLCQDAFLTVVRRAPDIRDPNALRSFIVGVAIRTARHEIRKRALRRFVGLDEAVEPLVVHPVDSDKRIAVERVYRALEQLDSLSRAAFVLRHVEGYELEETARLCGCSLATIKRRLARAEKRFQALSRGDAVLRDLLSEDVG